MASTRNPSRPLKTRKLTHSYSFTLDGDSAQLTTLPSPPPFGRATIKASPSPLSVLASPEHNQTSSTSVPNPCNYMPCKPVPRGPRSNLYLFPPTDADYAKARRWSTLKAAATEDARREREDDERRRNIILGITGPRKSMRRIKSTASIIPEQCPMGMSPSISEARARRDRRVAAKATKSVVQHRLVGDVSTPVNSPATSLDSLLPSSEGLLSSKKSHSRSQRRSDLTARLTTRSQAKAKASMLRDGECDTLSVSATPSEAEATDLDLEVPDERSSDSPQNSLKGSTRFENSEIVSKLCLYPEVNNTRTNLSRDSSIPSTDTLCDSTQFMPHSLSKKVALPGTSFRSHTYLSSSRSSSLIATSPTRRIIPLAVTTIPPLAGDKRKLAEIETESTPPLQTQCRRSGRVPKKRKLY